jgi:hypothetical protein
LVLPLSLRYPDHDELAVLLHLEHPERERVRVRE